MAASDPQIPWVQEQNALWRELAGSTITAWSGLDWHAGIEEEDAERVFLDKSDPLRQLCVLRMHRGDNAPLNFGGYQNDHAFGLKLVVTDGAELEGDSWSRESDVSDLPVGPVERLVVHLDDRPGSELDVIEAHLTIAGRPLLVVRAEVYFSPETGPAYWWADESIFVFSEPRAADDLTWVGGRQFLPRLIRPDEGSVFTGTRLPS